MAEVVFKDSPEWVIAIPAVYEANERVWLRFGLGAELVRDEMDNLTLNKKPLVRLRRL